ncbi:unnamed protein product [Clonostachys byssicola]|uniref:Uncharacterized protein n=1 Tax=Clonostachys byssicola TaxID=160290 RepID=A0A9N9Y4U3_9HYPO|nr:unnamed protein product [Clonostachys byssicola]
MEKEGYDLRKQSVVMVWPLTPPNEKREHSLPIALADPPALGILVVTQRDRIERTLVEDHVPTVGLRGGQDVRDVPLLEAHASHLILVAARGDLVCQRYGLGAVVDAEHASRPWARGFFLCLIIAVAFIVVVVFVVAYFPEREEQRSVAAAQIEEGGVGAGQVGPRGEELEDLGLGVGVVEPDGADVAGVRGVVGQLVRVELVPAAVLRTESLVEVFDYCAAVYRLYPSPKNHASGESLTRGMQMILHSALSDSQVPLPTVQGPSQVEALHYRILHVGVDVAGSESLAEAEDTLNDAELGCGGVETSDGEPVIDDHAGADDIAAALVLILDAGLGVDQSALVREAHVTADQDVISYRLTENLDAQNIGDDLFSLALQIRVDQGYVVVRNNDVAKC